MPSSNGYEKPTWVCVNPQSPAPGVCQPIICQRYSWIRAAFTSAVLSEASSLQSDSRRGPPCCLICHITQFLFRVTTVSDPFLHISRFSPTRMQAFLGNPCLVLGPASLPAGMLVTNLLKIIYTLSQRSKTKTILRPTKSITSEPAQKVLLVPCSTAHQWLVSVTHSFQTRNSEERSSLHSTWVCAPACPQSYSC